MNKNTTELALKKNREYELSSFEFLMMTPSAYKVTPHKTLTNLHKPQEGIMKICTLFLKTPLENWQYLQRGKDYVKQGQSFGEKSDFTAFHSVALDSNSEMLGRTREPDPETCPNTPGLHAHTANFSHWFANIQLVQKHVFNKKK